MCPVRKSPGHGAFGRSWYADSEVLLPMIASRAVGSYGLTESGRRRGDA
jgi:hypothetical protein